MKKEPLYYAAEILKWCFALPIALTENSKHKSLRVFGVLITFPFAITWMVTGIPVIICVIVLLIAQICYNA